MSEILIKKIRGGIMGIQNGTKTPQEVIGLLVRLKDVNFPMYEELLAKYIQIVKDKKSYGIIK